VGEEEAGGERVVALAGFFATEPQGTRRRTEVDGGKRSGVVTVVVKYF
jgi:hypothetical protein